MFRIRNVSTKSSYFDRPDTSERIFFIYNLARYDNRPHYHYGETSDLYHTELMLKSRVPIYTRVCYYPVHGGRGLSEFEAYIQNKRVKTLNIDNIFALEDADEMVTVLECVNAIFAENAYDS